MSLKNLVVLTAVATVTVSSANAQDELKTYAVEETVVTATKHRQQVEHVPQPVTVVTGEEIARRQAYNAGDMLDLVPGVRVIRSGSVGASNGVSIRSLNGGPASNKSLVLLDGRPLNDPWSGGINWHSVPAEMIDRIEVVRGPGSALYGSQASGGVINVFTKQARPGFHGWISVGHEFNLAEDIDDNGADGYGRAEIGATKIGLNGSYGSEKTGHFFSLGYRNAVQSFPTPNENSWDNYDIFYKAEHEFTDDLTSRVTLDLHNNTWDNEAERTPGENATDQVSGDISLRWNRGEGILNGRLYMNRSDIEETVYQSNLKTGEQTTRTGIMADYTLPLGGSSMIITGFDAYIDNADVDYDKTVVRMTPRGVDTVNIYDSKTGSVSQVMADTFDGVYGSNSQSYDENNIAVFAQYSQTLVEKLTVVAGGRFDVHSEFGSIFNPKVGITYDVFERDGKTTTMKVNYGTAFRAPPMWGLFSQSTSGYGDPDLEPEKTKNIDVGLFQRFGGLGHLELTFFHMDVNNLLINDTMGSTGEGYYAFVPAAADIDTIQFKQRKNLGNYSPKGLEFGFKVRPHRFVSVSGAYTFLDPGDFTFQTSKNRFNLGIGGFVPVGGHRLEAEVLYNSTGDGYFFDYETRPFEAFALTDFRLTFAYRGTYRISLNVRNLADTNYRLWHYAWQPGRTAILSLETSF